MPTRKPLVINSNIDFYLYNDCILMIEKKKTLSRISVPVELLRHYSY